MRYFISKTMPGPSVFNEPRRLASARRKQLKARFETMTEQAVMRPANSPWASPLRVIPKKNGSLRHCGDRVLNACFVSTGIHRRISKMSRNICTGLTASGRRFTPHRNDEPAELSQPHTKTTSEVVRPYVQQKKKRLCKPISTNMMVDGAAHEL